MAAKQKAQPVAELFAMVTSRRISPLAMRLRVMLEMRFAFSARDSCLRTLSSLPRLWRTPI